jgi:hypothetical protein
MNIPMNNDPEVEYRNEFAWGFDIKETICLVISAVIVIGITVLCAVVYDISPQVGCYLGLPLVVPIMLLGFAKPSGMSVMEFLKEKSFERKTKSLAYDADEIVEYDIPFSLKK